MSIQKEIERRWLLKGVPPIVGTLPKKEIIQIYIEENGKNVRYRSSKDHTTHRISYYRTSKVNISNGEWLETEDEISLDEFSKAYLTDYPLGVKKIRYELEENKLLWELDVFLMDMSLVILEVELDDINQIIEIPKALEPYIIMEITGIDSFQNYRLKSQLI